MKKFLLAVFMVAVILLAYPSQSHAFSLKSWFVNIFSKKDSSAEVKVSTENIKVEPSIAKEEAKVTPKKAVNKKKPDPVLVTFPATDGEIWERWTKHEIKWKDNTISKECLTSECYSQDKYYNISLVSPDKTYGLIDGRYGFSYAWTVGKSEMYDFKSVPDGKYKILVCKTDKRCNTSKNSFTLATNPNINNPVPEVTPVISNVVGPSFLHRHESGTWTVSAHDSNNENLTYQVDWQDTYYDSFSYPDSPTSLNVVHFSHNYSKAGTYHPVFSVINSNRISTEFSATVTVSEDNVSSPGAAGN